MPVIQPFRGIHYNFKKITDYSAVIAPPYDVISPAEQEMLYNRSHFNIIRLELGQSASGDSQTSNKYTRARDQLHLWLKEGVLVREDKPAFYIFEHRFIHRSEEKRRWDLSVRLRLEDWTSRKVRPHEAILKEPVSDRLNLLRTCQINISTVLGFFRHKEEGLLSLLPYLARGKPDVSVTDYNGIIHNMWIVFDPTAINDICEIYRDKVMYIADGHHRYQTALAFRDEHRRQSGKYSDDSDYVLATLMDAGDPGLLTLPTHRLVRGLSGEDLRGLTGKLQKAFYIRKIRQAGQTGPDDINYWLEQLEKRGRRNNAIGVYGTEGNDLLVLQPVDGESIRKTMPVEHSEAWKKLDVSLLHWAVLRDLLGITNPDEQKDQLEYVKDASEAVNRVNSGQYQLAFLLNPVPVSSIIAVADAGDRMPQKSSYFYPKPPTGLVMHPLF